MPHANAIFQNCFYVANMLNGILYGVELVLYAVSTSIMLNNKDERNTRSYRLFLLLSTGLLLMITVYVAVQALFGEEMWIIHADYPGGSAAYQADHAAVWYETLGSVASVALNLISDGLLLYRCYVVWTDRRVLIFPLSLYLITFGEYLKPLVSDVIPHSNFFTGASQHVALSYATVVISLNFTLSSLICGRLLYHAHGVEHLLGRDVAQKYTGAVALIVEAALPYTLFGIAYVITLGLHSPTTILFMSLYVMFTCISPQLIIIRVVLGRSFSLENNSTSQLSSNVHFTTSISTSTPEEGVPDSGLGSVVSVEKKQRYRWSRSSGASGSSTVGVV
ncbi:hypothetical protein BD309DRAFT_1000670 [Dichomitus squalens]|uniref:Uncharacterized protein n=1 Tax=Dichomitus squalens TaxID=114155 RepID=A0A4Q9NVU5_9APHY|nr:hypothetical protein BD309DRAFT_1000670 [Dichomitus squalens]TBU54246.1 hypothetical protein BD310DRAFT_828428 [Dichomitus squalens]